jgi:hypothetical protein
VRDCVILFVSTSSFLPLSPAVYPDAIMMLSLYAEGKTLFCHPVLMKKPEPIFSSLPFDISICLSCSYHLRAS